MTPATPAVLEFFARAPVEVREWFRACLDRELELLIHVSEDKMLMQQGRCRMLTDLNKLLHTPKNPGSTP